MAASGLRSCRRFLQISTKYSDRRLYSSTGSDHEVIVAHSEIKDFVKRCMLSVGAKETHANSLADVLVAADERGHYSHGLNRLEMYVHDINTGTTVGDAEPEIVRQTVSTALVEGNNVLGPAVGNFSMKLAIEKAKATGIGWIAVRGSNHYGIAGFYSMQALDHGLLGMSFTNTSPIQTPTRAKKASLGTNAMTLAAPGKGGDSFVLDMATSTVAIGKIEIQKRKNEPIPSGWGADCHGQETHDPDEVLDSKGSLLPLGGLEKSGGYKGYGLAMMVEIFCGILADAAWGPHVRKWMNTDQVANLGQCFAAIDPEAFGVGFTDRMQALIDTCRSLEPISGETEVLVAGDPERQHMAMCKAKGGVPYHPNLMQHLDGLAATLVVTPMKRLT